MIFQIPIQTGYHPFPAGTRVYSRTRSWWGRGVVLNRPEFTVRWEDYGNGYQLVTRGLVSELQLVRAEEA